MTDRELMQQALDALHEIHPGNMTPMAEEAWNKAIEAIRARLAQPEQEPVAYKYAIWTKEKSTTGVERWVERYDRNKPDNCDPSVFIRDVEPLYTAPPQREWQGLTDDDAQAVIETAMKSITEGMNTFSLTADKVWIAIIQAVEAKLKEKNA